MRYFKWDELSDEMQLGKTKVLLSHLKNNAKVRNWTLREGRPNRYYIKKFLKSIFRTHNQNNTDTLWKRYTSLLGPNGMAAMNEILTSQMNLNSMAGTGSLLTAAHQNITGEILSEENGKSVKLEDDDEEVNENSLNKQTHLNCDKILSSVGK